MLSKMIRPSLKQDRHIVRLIISEAGKFPTKKDKDFLTNWVTERIEKLENEKFFTINKDMRRRYSAIIKGLKHVKKLMQ